MIAAILFLPMAFGCVVMGAGAGAAALWLASFPLAAAGIDVPLAAWTLVEWVSGIGLAVYVMSGQARRR